MSITLILQKTLLLLLALYAIGLPATLWLSVFLTNYPRTSVILCTPITLYGALLPTQSLSCTLSSKALCPSVLTLNDTLACVGSP